MSALSSFLESVRDDPLDDTPRLIFADWLQEQSDPLLASRGELLRVQCQLNGGRAPCPLRASLEERQHQLLQAHRADWLGAFVDFCQDCVFDRGLVRATLEARTFVGRKFAVQGKELLERAWVETVWLKKSARHIKAIAVTEALANLSGLDLDGGGLSDAELAPLWQSRHTGRLRRLELANNALTDVSMARLLASPLSQHLLYLDLRNNALSDTGIRLLLASPLAKRLRWLELHGNALEPATQKQLADWQRDRQQTQPGELPRRITNSIGMEMVLVPAGSFWMGGGGGKAGDEQVTLAPDYYLGIYPVTQKQWQTLMGNNPSWFSRDGDGRDQVQSITDEDLKQFPVERVSWEDAQEFIRRLNAREKNSGWTYCLPAETEWEYACRGGASSTEECSFHFYLDRPSNNLSSDQANLDYHLQRTTKVGSYQANRLGIFDMHGNVWEWCEDLDEGGLDRMIRGCNWRGRGVRCTATDWDWLEPGSCSLRVGFRLLAVPSV